jgi:CheY-like chemotaxis protein
MTQFNNFFLIDDDTTSNFLNEKMVEKTGLAKHIKVFNYANIALNELQQLLQHPGDFPDLIFLDIQMPFMDGWEFLEQFQNFPKAVLNRCKLFMFSSSVNVQDVEKSKTYSIVKGFIHKPLTMDKMRELAQADKAPN